MGNSITAHTNVASLNIQTQIKKHTSDASAATVAMASGKRDAGPASAAIAALINSTVSVLSQSKVSANNAIGLLQVAQGGQNEIKSLASIMSSLASQSSDGSLDDSKRVMIDNQFQQMAQQIDDVANRTRWNGVPLLSGGAGTGTAAPAVTQAATGMVASTVVGMAGTLNAASKGFISGQVQDVSVGGSAGAYTVSAKVGNQIFYAEGVTPTANGTLNLVSNVDTGSIISLDFGADVSGITDKATFTTALKESLGLTAGAARASFVSEATAVNNGLTGLSVGGNTTAGTYAFRYDAGSGQATLTNGEQVWTEDIATTGAAQNITFNNGMTASFDNSFVVGTGVTQVIYQVSPDTENQVSLTFQLAEKATDVLTVNIDGASRAALGLTGLSVNTKDNATAATTAIADALETLNQSGSLLGAQKNRLESTISNLDTQIENLTAAQSNYEDTDIAKAMTDYTLAVTRQDIANLSLSKSLQAIQKQVSVVQG